MTSGKAATPGLRRSDAVLRTAIRLRRRLTIALRHAVAAWLPGLLVALLAAEKLDGPRWLVLLPAGVVLAIFVALLSIQSAFRPRTGSKGGSPDAIDRTRFHDTELSRLGRVVSRVHSVCFAFLLLVPMLAVPVIGLLAPVAYLLGVPTWVWFVSLTPLLVAPAGLSLSTLYLDAVGHFERCRAAARSATIGGRGGGVSRGKDARGLLRRLI